MPPDQPRPSFRHPQWLVGCGGRVVSVALHERMHEMAAGRPRAEDIGEFGEVEEPIRVSRRPVIVGAVG